MDSNTGKNLVCNQDGILIREGKKKGLLYKLLGQLDRHLEKKLSYNHTKHPTPK